MARVSHRQGIVRTHSTAIQFTSGNTEILVNAVSGSVIYTFADGPDTDYLYEEAGIVDPAWTNLPSANQYWLYYELNSLTGERTFGTTIYQPIEASSPPNNPAVDQHWFDTRASYEHMNVWNGKKWVPKIRVFSARVNGTVITQYDVGSQAGLDDATFAGLLLFDDENKTRPIKRYDRRGRGKFITTETSIFSQFSNLTGFRPEQAIVDGEAVEPIGRYQCIALKGARKLGLAKNIDSEFPCIGIALEPIATGEVRSYVTSGYLSDDDFSVKAPKIDFTLDPGTLIFVGNDGQMATDVPQSFSIQRVGVLIDELTILVNIEPLILYA